MYGVATEWEQHRILRSAVTEHTPYQRLEETRHGYYLAKISHTLHKSETKKVCSDKFCFLVFYFLVCSDKF